MRFGIIKERKNPPDRRVVFSPLKLKELKEKFSEAIIKVEPSAIRIYRKYDRLRCAFWRKRSTY